MQALKHIHIVLSRRTVIFILILTLLTGFTVYFAITPQREVKQPIASLPTPTPYQTAMLSFEKSATSSPAAYTQRQVNILLDSGQHRVTVVQLELGFDPKAIQNISIVPGNFFPGPLEILKDINYQTGRISYVLSVKLHSSGIISQGIIATLSYESNPTATISSTPLIFLPKTQVNAEGLIPSILKTTTNTVLQIK